MATRDSVSSWAGAEREIVVFIMIMVGSVRKAVGSVPAGERSKHATIAVQRTHRIAQIAQIPRCAKNACSGDNPTGRNRTIQYRRRGGKSARAGGGWGGGGGFAPTP